MNKFFNFDAAIQHAFNDNESDFVAFNKLLVDTYDNNLDGLSAKEANAKIVEIFRNVLGCDETASKKDLRKAIRRNQVQLFDIMEEVIQDLLVKGWEDDAFFNEYVDVRNLALGDKNEFYVEDDSVLSIMRLSGNHHDIIRQRLGAGEAKSINTYWVGAKIYSEFERLMTGAEDWAKFVSKVLEAYNKYINNALYQALLDAANGLAAMWKKTGNIVEATLRQLCMDVAMATGCEVVIMGTRVALAPVYALNSVSWASNEMKNEKYTTGRFGYWEGIRLVEIPQGIQSIDETTGAQYLVANDKLFIMPMADNKFIKLVNEGDSQVYQVTDAATRRDMTYEYEFQTKIGVGIVTNLRWAMWDTAVVT